MGRLIGDYCFLLLLLVGTSGCSIAKPDVKSLFSSLHTFNLSQYSKRIDNLSALGSIVISGNCDGFNNGFEIELPDSPGVWSEAVVGGHVLSVVNQCSSNRTFSVTLDLTTLSAFSSLTLGSSESLKIRDKNTMGMTVTETFTVTYSTLDLVDSGVIYGQGLNNVKVSGDYTLKGRVINVPRLPSTVGTSHTLQGKVVFE